MDWPAHLHGPAGWVHDKRLSLALTADKIVREMVAYPEPAKATSNPPVAGRLAQALLQEVAAHISERMRLLHLLAQTYLAR